MTKFTAIEINVKIVVAYFAPDDADFAGLNKEAATEYGSKTLAAIGDALHKEHGASAVIVQSDIKPGVLTYDG